MALRQRRIGWLLAAFALLLALAAARAFELTTLNAGTLSSAGNAEHSATVTIPAPRGEIVDRNGVILATTEAAYDITATPDLVSDLPAFALELAPVLHETVGTIEHNIRHPTSSSAYTVLARQQTPTIAAEVRKLALAGVAVSADPRRIYPEQHGYLAAQVLGGVGANGSGLGGIEYELNRALSGSAGVQPVVYDGEGQPIKVGGTTPVAGKTVQLTIDAALQQWTDSVVASTGREFRAQNATGIVLDPRSGAVYAMSNWPRVNANDSANADAENYAIGQDYEPGSTFKVVAVGGALSEGLITPYTKFTVPDCIHVADRTICDAEYHPTEQLTPGDILQVSSNVGAVEIGEKLGAAGMYRWMRAFGFGSPTGIGLLDDAPGQIPLPAQWSGSSIGNIPFGQGVDVTPLQIADAYAAIANGGVMAQPHLIERVGGRPVSLPAGRRILTPLVAAELRRMLERVTAEGGTAAQIQIPPYTLAAKTGTAQKVVGGVYSNTEFWASFVGIAPASDPRLEAIVLVNDPKGGEYYGTEVAAPAWEKIMEFALPYLKISPTPPR